jgi:hypothetical protein
MSTSAEELLRRLEAGEIKPREFFASTKKLPLRELSKLTDLLLKHVYREKPHAHKPN